MKTVWILAGSATGMFLAGLSCCVKDKVETTELFFQPHGDPDLKDIKSEIDELKNAIKAISVSAESEKPVDYSTDINSTMWNTQNLMNGTGKIWPTTRKNANRKWRNFQNGIKTNT